MDTYYNSPCGLLKIKIGSKGLISLKLSRNEIVMHNPDNFQDDAYKLYLKICKWLDAYFAGKALSVSELDFDLHGTDFQKTIWNLLLKIPYGKTASYKQIGESYNILANHEPSRFIARAVGQAVGANPVCIIIPCHRVIRSDGALGGYAYGLEMKKFLLNLENKNNKPANSQKILPAFAVPDLLS